MSCCRRWHHMAHPTTVCCISSRLATIVVALLNIGIVVFSGITRHYGFLNWDTFFSFELTFVDSRYGDWQNGNFGQDSDASFSAELGHLLLTVRPFFLAAYPSFLLAAFLCNCYVLYGAWFHHRMPLVIWLALKGLHLAFTLLGTAAHFYLALTTSTTIRPSEPLMLLSFLLQVYSFWIVLDLFCFLNTVHHMSVDEMLEVVAPLNRAK